jgi:1-acyl-sn-glycerol-3-phosphate acyltransferase
LRKAVLFLRSLVFAVVMAIATVIWSFVCMLAAPLPYNKRYYVT